MSRVVKRENGSRRGFTIVELLVTISVVAILVALLAPAIQLARETARRSRCKNRLRSLTIACQNYESANGHFPPGCVLGQGAGWSAFILNQIDEPALADQLDLSDSSTAPSGSGNAVNWTNDPNESVCATFIPLFRCPMDPAPENLDSGSGPAMKDRVPSSYIGVASGTTKTHNDMYWSGSKTMQSVGDAKSGVMIPTQKAEYFGTYRWNSKVGMNDIRDGASYTLMLGETVFDTSTFEGVSKGIDHWYIGSYQVDYNIELSEFLGSTKIQLNMYHRYSDDALLALSSGQRSTRFSQMAFGFASWHADDGVTFSFADGATRFIKGDIDEVLYSNLGNRADNESVSDYFR